MGTHVVEMMVYLAVFYGISKPCLVKIGEFNTSPLDNAVKVGWIIVLNWGAIYICVYIYIHIHIQIFGLTPPTHIRNYFDKLENLNVPITEINIRSACKQS